MARKKKTAFANYHKPSEINVRCLGKRNFSINNYYSVCSWAGQHFLIFDVIFVCQVSGAQLQVEEMPEN